MRPDLSGIGKTPIQNALDSTLCPMLTLILSVKLIVEIALMSLFGQWVLGLLTGQGRQGNLIYQLFAQVSGPFVRLAGRVTPGFILARHHPLVAFVLLGLAWGGITLTKIAHCLSIGVQLCR